MIRSIIDKRTIGIAFLLLMTCFVSEVYAGSWVEDASAWYYINEDGSKATGRISDSGKDYYLAEDGKMLTEGVHLLPNDQIIICNADGSIFYSNSFHREGLDDEMLLKSYQDAYNNWGILQNAYNDLNNRRMAEGGSAFTSLDFELSVIATYRCEDMILNNYYSHYKDGVFEANEVAASYSNDAIKSVGENISFMSGENGLLYTPGDFLIFINEKYMLSPGHYRNIMGNKTKVGLGAVLRSDGNLIINAQIFSY